MALETVMGNLRNAYKQIIPGTMLHSAELTTERRGNPELRDLWFYTADGLLYFMRGDKPHLALTREKDNLVLRHIDKAFAQLTEEGNYHPDNEEAEESIHSSDTLVVDLSELRLVNEEVEYSCLRIPTTRYGRLNRVERALAERIYGQGKDFVLNMSMLTEAGIGIDRTSVNLLNPSYVQNIAKNGPIQRASWLDYFYNSSFFDAYNRFIGQHFRLRGTPRASEAHIEMPKPDLKRVLATVLPNVPQDLHQKVMEELRNLYKP